MDEILEEAIKLTIENGYGSVSLLQRRLSLGYNKAEELMLKMESMGIISPKDSAKPRELLVKK